jgi:hypothetical protein
MFEEELSGNASWNRQEEIWTRRRKLKQEQLKNKNDGQKNQAQGLIVNNDKAAAAAAFKEGVQCRQNERRKRRYHIEAQRDYIKKFLPRVQCQVIEKPWKKKLLQHVYQTNNR